MVDGGRGEGCQPAAFLASRGWTPPRVVKKGPARNPAAREGGGGARRNTRLLVKQYFFLVLAPFFPDLIIQSSFLGKIARVHCIFLPDIPPPLFG